MRENIIVKENYEEMSREAAKIMYSVITNNPKAVIVIATGHSPRLAYRLLVEKLKSTRTDYSQVTFVKLDEWIGLTAQDEATCEYFIRTELLEPLQVEEKNYLHFITEAEDAESECARVCAEYAKLPKVDLVILGIGMNGHLGLNEPDDALYANAHAIALDSKTKTHEMLSHTSRPVQSGVTLGMKELFRGEQILLLADGAEKEKGLFGFLDDKITTKIPVSLLKPHTNCTCIINHESFPNMENF